MNAIENHLEIIENRPGLHWAILGSTERSWALLGFSWALLGSLLSWALPWALPWALLGSPGLSWAQLVPERASSVSKIGLCDHYVGKPEPERARSPCPKMETCPRALAMRDARLGSPGFS
jgi:hypothetical protein